MSEWWWWWCCVDVGKIMAFLGWFCFVDMKMDLTSAWLRCCLKNLYLSVAPPSSDLRCLCRFDHVLMKLFLNIFGRSDRSDLILTWLAVDEVIDAVSIEFDGYRPLMPLMIPLFRFRSVFDGVAAVMREADDDEGRWPWWWWTAGGAKWSPIELEFESNEFG